jgi:hypothetical protein
VTTPDPELLVDVVSAKVLNAMQVASDALARMSVRHVVVGGLAVGANGWPRATRDVDFLVGEEAFEHHGGGLVTVRAGLPIQVGGVAVDCLSVRDDEPFLAAALAAPPGSFAPAPVLVYMKLKSPRSKDRQDVIELIKVGIDVDACRSYLESNALQLVAKLDDAIRVARAEQEAE